MRRTAMILATTIATALTLAACTGSGKKAVSGADHSAADVTFAQSMIPHHEQAVEMAKLAQTRAADPEVKALAAQIQAAQAPEIKQMSGWLRSWGEPTAMPGMGGHDMAGMMSSADMAKLAGLTGNGFDREFVTMMIEHHNGAIQTARTEQNDGRNGAAKQLASNIIKSQSAEIARMANLLKAL